MNGATKISFGINPAKGPDQTVMWCSKHGALELTNPCECWQKFQEQAEDHRLGNLADKGPYDEPAA